MDSFLYLSELQSSFAHLALAFGCALVLPYLLNNRNWTHRTFLFAIGMALAVRYIWWRGTQTLAPPGFTLDCLFSWSFFALEALSVLSSLSAFTILTRTTDRSPEVEENKSWWKPDPPPKVAILIATYNEEQAVLERTIVGAKASDHPDVQVLVLDDGRRDWLRDFCEEHDVRYLRRPDNKGSKAGNINHALGVLAQDDQPPDFIAVLDADFVPHTDFVSRALALFHDQEVGLVQTPSTSSIRILSSIISGSADLIPTSSAFSLTIYNQAATAGGSHSAAARRR
ncbi:glycosyltransferase [Agrobacterium fabrum]|uniref:glycosyltransferase n=1 Tax=Agrobacterium fabrum TaxID=1176649 RepID=UPI0031B7F841